MAESAVQTTAQPNQDWPPGTIRIGRYNMHFNLTKFLINSLPFILLALWRFHFGLIYIGFPSKFASQYHPGWTCETITVPGGGMCEDIIEWKEQGLAILTCDGNRRKWNTVMGPLEDPDPKGQLVLIDYKQTPAKVQPMALDLPPNIDFHPLGAALYHGKYHTTLLVTNCRRNQSTIEVFELSVKNPTKSTWRRSLSHDLIPNGNAILPVSSTQFYVTNDHYFRRREHKYLHMSESYLALPLSFTTFVDFSGNNIKARKVVFGQRAANGITATPDLDMVFIAESTRGGFGVYKRTEDNSLDFQEYVKINGHTDNVHFHADGYINAENWGNSAVYAGLHPNIVRLVKFVKGIQNAPSWIVSARPAREKMEGDPSDYKGPLHRARADKETWDVRTEFQDAGEWFGGATGAIVDKQRGVMIGGGLYDANGAFICHKT